MSAPASFQRILDGCGRLGWVHTRLRLIPSERERLAAFGDDDAALLLECYELREA